MATLQNKRIKDTYQGLLKTEDNNIINNTLRQITDGQGTGTGISLNNQGDLTATGDIVANSFTGDGSGITNLPSAFVNSVNTQIGDVVLDTDDIAEGSTNEYYTDAKVEANSAVVANTAKVGITTEQANEIAANTLKTGITQAQADAIVVNSAKVGITTQQAADIQTNNDKVGITTEQANEIAANTLKNSYPTEDATKLATIEQGAEVNPTSTDELSEGSTNLYYTDDRVSANSAVVANTAKVGITTQQAADIENNNAKNSYPSSDATKLSGIEEGAEVNTVDSVNSLTGAVSLGLLDLDDVGSDGTSGQVLTTNGLGSFSFTTVSGGGDVDSVNGQTGTVVLDADDISDATTTNKFTTASDITKLSGIEAGAEVNPTSTDELSEGTTNLYYTDARVSANSAVAANTAKVGITTQQANDITTNNAKVSYPSADSTKVGFISVTQAVDLDTLESDVATNNAKVGITTQQANDITANNAKISFDSASSTKLAGIEAGAEVNPTSTDELSEGTTNLYYTDARVSANTDVAANTAKVGITTQQASDIVTNNAKVGITAQQASDITANNAKISFDSTSSTKLAGIEEGAQVNVNTDWDATSGDAEILNKPTLATVATSGSYNDLSDQPTIPTNNNQLTNGAGYITDGNTNWDNTYGFITASSTDTLTNKSGSNSQWTNDAGYTTNTGTVTSVSVGTGLDVTNGTTTPSITLDLSEFTDMTADLVGTDEFIVLDNGAERRKAANEISTSVLNTEIHTNAIGKAIDFSARVTLDGGVAEGTSAIIKNLQNVM